MATHVGIGKERLSLRAQLVFCLRTLWGWMNGRNSLDGRVKYIPGAPSDGTVKDT